MPAVLLVLGGVYASLDRQIGRLDERLNDVTKPEGSLSKLSERLGRVEAGIAAIQVELKYRPAAAALGLQDADIKRVQLTQQSAFTTSVVTSVSGARFIESILTYKILQVTDDRISLRVDGRIGTTTIDGLFVDMPIKHGELTPIRVIAGPGVPTLYIAILNRIPPNEAVIAVGTATNPPPKSSS